MLTIRESGGGNANRLVAYPVIPMENCQSPGGWVWSNVKNPGDGSLADTLVPVLDYNPHDADSYLMNSYGNGGSNVSMYKFADTNPPGALIGTNVPVPAYTVAPPAAQKGSNVFIETGNAAITQAVNYNNGTYATLTTGSIPNSVPRDPVDEVRPQQADAAKRRSLLLYLGPGILRTVDQRGGEWM
jgi:hypothetical protein